MDEINRLLDEVVGDWTNDPEKLERLGYYAKRCVEIFDKWDEYVEPTDDPVD